MRRALALVLLVACSDPLRAIDPPACKPWLGGHWDPRFSLDGALGVTGNVAGLAAAPERGVVATGRFAGGADVIVVADTVTPLPGYQIQALGTPVMVLADGAPAVAGDGLWRWDGAWRQVEVRPEPWSTLADADGGVVFATWIADGLDELFRWDSGGLASLGTLPLGVVRLGVLDGDLVALGVRETVEVWFRHDGAWNPMPGLEEPLFDLAVSPALGLIATTERTTWRWDAAGWQPLAAHGGRVRACSDGVLVVDETTATFTDGASTTTIPLPAVPILEVEPAHDGLYVGTYGGHGASIRRFGN